MRLTRNLKRTCGVPSPGPISPASHVNLHGYLSAIPGAAEIGAKSFLEFYNRSASGPSVSSSGENTQLILTYTTSGKVCNLQPFKPKLQSSEKMTLQLRAFRRACDLWCRKGRQTMFLHLNNKKCNHGQLIGQDGARDIR